MVYEYLAGGITQYVGIACNDHQQIHVDLMTVWTPVSDYRRGQKTAVNSLTNIKNA